MEGKTQSGKWKRRVVVINEKRDHRQEESERDGESEGGEEEE